MDYTSTAPWNDPYNPWPRYTQMFMQGVVEGVYPTEKSLYVNAVLSLTYFDPVGPGPLMAYTGMQEETSLDVSYDYFGGAWNWYILIPDVGDYFCFSRNAARDIFRNSSEWQWLHDNGSSGVPAMMPVLSAVAPWERRRLWNLNG